MLRWFLRRQVGDATTRAESIRSLLASAMPPSDDHDVPCSADQRRHHHRPSSVLTVWNASTTPSAEPPPALWRSSTSRRNLETIIEAIRHLEGDHVQPGSAAAGRRDDPGQSAAAAASNTLSPLMAETLMAASSGVQFAPSKTCVAVRSS